MRTQSDALPQPSATRLWHLTPLREIFGVDLRTLALFRILLGGYLILDLCLRAQDLTAHYTDFGVLPRDVAMSFLSPTSVSVHFMNGGAAFQGALFVLAGICAVMLVFGWRTRLATILSWALLLSLQNRNTAVLSGEDHLALLLLFWAMFLPLGARYSVDAALDETPHSARHDYVSVGSAALLIQGMSMYFFSALLKSDPIWIPDGTAVYYALQLDYFATSFALWLRQFEGLLQGLTFYVWALELVGPILIFSPFLHRPLRAALMLCFVTFHLGLAASLKIGLFPLISIIMNLTFMPGWMWDQIETWLRPKRPADLRIWYDGDCSFCLKICRIITTFLFLRGTPTQPAQSDPRIGPVLARTNSWVVTAEGRDHLRWRALCRLVAASPVFRPLAPLCAVGPVARLGEAGYSWVARNRQRLASVFAWLLRHRPVRITQTKVSSLLAAAALVFVSVQNLSTLPSAGIRLPSEFLAVRQALGLYQYWTMFAPHPEMNSPWPVIQGTLTDGTPVDVYNRRLSPPDQTRPPVVSSVYANGRWRKLLSNLEDQSYSSGPHVLALNYGRYLCRSWRRARPNDPPLKTFTIVFQVDWSSPPGQDRETRQNLVWTHDCFG